MCLLSILYCTLTCGQIHCTSVQTSIRMCRDVFDPIHTETFAAILYTDLVEKIVANLVTQGRNSIEIDIFLVENLDRAAINDDDALIETLEFEIAMQYRQMSVEKMYSVPCGTLCGEKTVVSVPLIILHVDAPPSVRFNHVWTVLWRFQDSIWPNLLISPTPVCIAKTPSSVAFFCISENIVLRTTQYKRWTVDSHDQKMKIEHFHLSSHASF